jgi:hypothetical protein
MAMLISAVNGHDKVERGHDGGKAVDENGHGGGEYIAVGINGR